ncbi:unnamed protein product [Cylindrotheca closterium]|uniref:Uncharacterized protein n=1 Tax=Cylindrotheca closterium TaxID=2856 RepID=A0AAD2FZV8_9STRA|nr:unnamed protein product [Cylindrotheca closterium]
MVQWFRIEWKRIEPRLVDSPLRVLKHSMENMLRMSDGLIFLTSGECRHPYDVEEARKTKYRSKLSTLKERGDGYTCLYKSDAIYSGFGWDEFANETVGIQARLISILKQYMKSPWDYLERKGATELLESLLGQHELAVKELQQEVQNLKNIILQDIKLRLKPKKLCFATQDKMERLFVAYGKQTISLERRADNFQLEKDSVLPASYDTIGDWKRYELSLSANESCKQIKKRRMVIQDTDSDSDSVAAPQRRKKRLETQTSNQNATGLKVKVKTTTAQAEKEDSVHAIKAQMGVDAAGLETSREELEHEIVGERDSSNELEEKNESLGKVLQRVLARQDRDDDEVWDARECLRQSHMELGNEYLWSKRDFPKAQESFQQAQRLVKDQQDSHNRVVLTSNDDTPESHVIGRNLLFLLAQASLNGGICHVERGLVNNNKIPKGIVNSALKEFYVVQSITADLRQQALEDEQASRIHSSHWNECHEDSLRATQLESLSHRWIGVCLWNASRETDAIESLQKASSFFKINGEPRSELIPSILEVAAECIFACCALSDLVCSAMEKLPRNSLIKGDHYIVIVERALRRYAEIVGKFERYPRGDAISESFQAFRESNNIKTSEAVLNHIAQVRGWWKKKKSQPTSLMAKDSASKVKSTLPRFDVFSSGLTSSNNHHSTAHITLSSGRRLQQRRGVSKPDSNPATAFSALPGETETAQQMQFRKWGDQLLSSHSDPTAGDSIPQLVYPSIAPPIPEDLRALIQG